MKEGINMKKYSIGIDYGTLSARALLCDLSDGREVASCEFFYPHAVMNLSSFGLPATEEMQLQHPQDYIDALSYTMHDILEKSSVSPDDIVGIGFDFTSCTVLPVLSDGTPLCFLEKYKNTPHAYVKLWKHHGAQKEADDITALAKEIDSRRLESYGGKISSEWLFPKLLEILNKAPEVFEDTARFIEAGDWLTWVLTGKECRSSCMAGYKSLWNKQDGFPNNEFWAKLDDRFGNIIGTKICENVVPTGTKIGNVCEKGTLLTGLSKKTAVAAPIIDAHAALPASGITTSGKLMIIAGTSSCHIVMNEEMKKVKGICGCVVDGIIPGLVAYEAGQASVGDSFEWFVKNCVPEEYKNKASEMGVGIFEYLDEKAQKLEVGENGILALDWFNGNRTPFSDAQLSSVILGITLSTKPEEIYRAILESTAFGTKSIVELYEKSGVAIDEIYASGGISYKNSFLMQLYADVLGRKIKISGATQAGAKGSAIFASVAGGYFENISAAARVLSDKCIKEYAPNLENSAKYSAIYEEYVKLSRYFAKENDVMKKLKGI